MSSFCAASAPRDGDTAATAPPRAVHLLCSASLRVPLPLNQSFIPLIRVSWLIRLAQVAFFTALIFTFYSAVIPPKQALQLAPWDKAEHFMAFYALTGLAGAGFPRGRLWV